MTELLYTKKIHVSDPSTYAETELKKKEFYIQFADKVTESVKKDIFSKSDKSAFTVKADKDTLKVSTILPKYISLIHFKYLIAHILHVHVTAIELNHDNNLASPESIDIYEKNACINNYDFEVTIKQVTKPRYNNYDKQVIPVIDKYSSFLSKFKSNNIKYRFQYTQVSFAMYLKKQHSVDIVRLFNMNQTSKDAPKIYLHDEDINDFRNETNSLMGAIKCKDPTLRPLQGLESSKNECGFLYNHAIDGYPHIRLYNLSILKNGLVVFIFKNIRFDDDKSIISDILSKWMQKNAYQYLDNIHLDECIYDTNFNIKQYQITELSHCAFIQLFTGNKLSNLNVLNTLPAYSNVYTTKTSYRETGPQTMATSTQLILNQCHNVSPTFQPTMMDFYFSCIVQLNQNEEGILIEIRNSGTDDNTKLILDTVAGKIDIHDVAPVKDLVSKLVTIDSKIRIQQLKNADPVIFGSRSRDNVVKDYSQMVQNNEQRPSVLTEDEYKLLKVDYPNACLNVETQTTHERLYLMCPFEEYPIINYHAEKDQTCIIKCTSNFANASQYNLCDEQLNGLDNDKTIENRYASNTVVKFSTHILPGRRCFLPPELLNIFPHCHLLKLPDDVPVQYTVSDKYRMLSFVLERHSDHYDIATEYEDGISYAVVIKIYGSKDSYIMCEQETNTPYVFNDESKNTFVHQLIKTSQARKQNVDFIRFINETFGLKYDDDANVKDVIDELVKNGASFYNSYSDYRRVVAMMMNKKLYTIPEIFNLEFIVEPIPKVMDKIPDALPSLSEFDTKHITRYYVHYKDQVVVGIRYLNNIVLVKAEKIPKISMPIEYVNLSPFMYQKFGFGTTTITKPLTHVAIIDSNAILTILINVCLKVHGKVDAEILQKVAADRLADKTDLIYVGNVVSWRKSKIDRKLLKSVNFSKESIMKLMYEFTLINSKFIYDSSKEYMYRRLIY